MLSTAKGLEHPERLEDRSDAVDGAHGEEYCEQEPRAAALQASLSAKRHKQSEENQYPQGVERHGAIRRARAAISAPLSAARNK
jgi:hypothetical protein